MKPKFYIFIACILVLACTKKSGPVMVDPPFVEKYEGGKGGTYGIAVFSKYNNKGMASRIFLKYAAAKAPSDTALYDEKSNTMTEAGFGPHAHFNSLKKGTYYIAASANINGTRIIADTVLWLTDSSLTNQDIYINLK